MKSETINTPRPTETIDGIEYPRLYDGERWHAVNAFVWDRLGSDCSGDDFDACAAECCILYRDDYDAGESYYQVVDAQGHGDGSGIWTPVGE